MVILKKLSEGRDWRIIMIVQLLQPGLGDKGDFSVCKALMSKEVIRRQRKLLTVSKQAPSEALAHFVPLLLTHQLWFLMSYSKQKWKWCLQAEHFLQAGGMCVHALLCAFVCMHIIGRGGRIRPFDESPDDPGQLPGAEQSRGHQRAGAQARGPISSLPLSACLSLPPVINTGS